MSVVRINAITVPAERADELLKRFANRAGEVSKMPGFEAFELLRPTDDRDVFLVYTRWATQADFDNWLNSQAFQQGQPATRRAGRSGRGASCGRSTWCSTKRRAAAGPATRARPCVGPRPLVVSAP